MAGFVKPGETRATRRTDWNTPQEIINYVLQLWPGGIDLDPCSNATSIVPARVKYTIRQDGLNSNWDLYKGRATRVFVNPPYGRGLRDWCTRIVETVRCNVSKIEIILLIPAAVETKHWQELCTTASRVCFPRRRVKFLGAKNSAQFPSALLYWGFEAPRFDAIFSKLGVCYRSTEPR